MKWQASLDTYRTLRAGLVATGLLLAVGLGFHIAGPEAGVPASISATYYTPLGGLFVATLLAVGLALVAVKGREGGENTLLDIAGALIPVAAFVPTPIPSPECPDPGRDCVPATLHPAVDLALRAYLTMGLVVLVVAVIRMLVAARTRNRWSVTGRRGLAAMALVWLGATGTYLLARPLFLLYAHYAAAISFFLLLVVVVWINGRQALGLNALAHLPAAWYRRVYRVIAAAMLIATVAGVAMFVATGRQNAVVGGPAPFPVIFWIEVVLLGLFITYWVFQTVELWNHTVPPAC